MVLSERVSEAQRQAVTQLKDMEEINSDGEEVGAVGAVGIGDERKQVRKRWEART